MDRNNGSQKRFKELKKSPSISKDETIYLDNMLVFSKIREKTQDIPLSGSPYIRLVELLHLFSINMHDYFQEYIFSHYSVDEMDSEIESNISEIQKRFIHDIVRYRSNPKSLDKFFSVFTTLLDVDVRGEINYTYNEDINSYMKKLAESVSQYDSSLIFDYSCYKKFFAEFFREVTALLNLPPCIDPLSYRITQLHLSEFGISFLRPEFISDLHSDYIEKLSVKIFHKTDEELKDLLIKTIEQYCIYKSPKTESLATSPVNFLDIFASFRENWTIISNLANNQVLSNYLFNSIINCSSTKETTLASIKKNLENENPLDIVGRCISYAYLLNYVPIQHTRVKSNVIISFFQSKCETGEINTVIFCIDKLIYLASISEKDLEILFYYACTIK